MNEILKNLQLASMHLGRAESAIYNMEDVYTDEFTDMLESHRRQISLVEDKIDNILESLKDDS